jgi:adenylate cyclase
MYVGDRIIALWGAPTRTDRHAQLACESALQMRNAVFKRQVEWERRFGHPLRVHMGLATGEVAVGDMGSDLKSNYTVIGASVELAGRLEAANRAFGTSILVADSTVQRAGPKLLFREIDRIRVEGQAEPLRLHELLGEGGAMPRGRARQVEPFARALDAYHRQRFSEAAALFERCQELSDPTAAIYLERCRAYLRVPPPPEWDGVYERA